MSQPVNPRALTRVAYAAMFTNGVTGITVAPALPYLIQEYQLGFGIAGLLFPARSLGSLLGSLLGGPWSDRVGRRTAVVAGALLQAVSLSGAALCRTWFLSLFFFIFYGMGTGIMGVGINALVAELNPHRRAAALNMAHGIYGLGSLLGPLGAGLALRNAFGWRAVFLAGGLAWLVYAALAAGQPFPPRPAGQIRATWRAATAVLADPAMVLFLLVAFLYNGTASGLTGWINTYLLSVAGMPSMLGATMISVFYAALTLGRIGGSLVTGRLGYRRTIMINALGVAVSYPLAITSRSPLLVTCGVGCSGLFFSTLYPTALAQANALFPQSAGSVAALMSAAMSLGAMSVPWLIGASSDLGGGLYWGMALAYTLVLVLVAMALVIVRQAHTPRQQKAI